MNRYVPPIRTLLELIARRTAATVAVLDCAAESNFTSRQLTALFHDLDESGARVLAVCDHLTGVTDPAEGFLLMPCRSECCPCQGKCTCASQ